MKVILNIGLAHEGNKNIGVGTVLGQLSQRGFNLQDYKIHHSDTEITVVAECEVASRYISNPVYFLAQMLCQDCIAVYYPHLATGDLIGPKADKWGEFNPELFILLDGARLAQPAKAI